MKKTFTNVEILFLVMGIMMPLQFYRIELMGLNWSFDRVILVLLIPAAVYKYFLNNFRAHYDVYIIVSWITLIIFNATYYSSSDGQIYAKQMLPSLLQVSIVPIIMHMVIKDDSIDKIFYQIMKYHFIIILYFALYSIYYSYVLELRTFKPPFISQESYYTWLDNNPHELGMMYDRRLTLPFSTSPYLSFVAGILAIHAYTWYQKTKQRKYILIGTIAFLIVIGTYSRSGLLALLLAFFIPNLFILKSITLKRENITVIFVILLALVSIGTYVTKTQPLGQFDRLFKINLANDVSLKGHWGVRQRILTEFIEGNPTQKIIGRGLGSTNEILKVSSGHMSFATVLFELGVFGELVFSYMLILPYLRIRKRREHIEPAAFQMYIRLFIFVIAAHMFYDATSFSMMWFYNGYILVATRRIIA